MKREQDQWGWVGERQEKGLEPVPWILRLLHLAKRGHVPGPHSLTFQHFCAGLCRSGNSDPYSHLTAQPSRHPAPRPPCQGLRPSQGRPGHTQGLGQQLLSLPFLLCLHCQAPFCQPGPACHHCRAGAAEESLGPWGQGWFCEDLGTEALPAPRAEGHTPVSTGVKSFL